MATRRAEVGGREIRFDHGAQYFTAHDPAFAAMCREWQAQGIVAPWPAAGESALVGVPGMNAPLRHMALTLDVRWGMRVDQIVRSTYGWRVSSEAGDYEFEQLAVAVPAEQAAVLLEHAAQALSHEAGLARSAPCWAVMAYFDQRLDIPDDAIKAPSASISWAARNGAKPAREGHESWVIHAAPEFSASILELSPEQAATEILAHFFVQMGLPPVRPAYLGAHRWRYAMVPPVKGAFARWDAALQIGVAGDWMASPRVEGAFQSGVALAEMIAGK